MNHDLNSSNLSKISKNVNYENLGFFLNSIELENPQISVWCKDTALIVSICFSNFPNGNLAPDLGLLTVRNGSGNLSWHFSGQPTDRWYSF